MNIGDEMNGKAERCGYEVRGERTWENKCPALMWACTLMSFPPYLKEEMCEGALKERRLWSGLCFNDPRDPSLQLAPSLWYWIAGKKKCLMDSGVELAQRCGRQRASFGCKFLVLTNKRGLKLIKSLCLNLQGDDWYKTKHRTSLCREGLAICSYG